jgi:hypothetical protein
MLLTVIVTPHIEKYQRRMSLTPEFQASAHNAASSLRSISLYTGIHEISTVNWLDVLGRMVYNVHDNGIFCQRAGDWSGGR